MDQQVINIILNHLERLNTQVESLSNNQTILKEQSIQIQKDLFTNTVATEKLNEYMFHGKAIVKVLATLAAVFAGIGASWDWVAAHFRM